MDCNDENQFNSQSAITFLLNVSDDSFKYLSIIYDVCELILPLHFIQTNAKIDYCLVAKNIFIQLSQIHMRVNFHFIFWSLKWPRDVIC